MQCSVLQYTGPGAGLGGGPSGEPGRGGAGRHRRHHAGGPGGGRRGGRVRGFLQGAGIILDDIEPQASVYVDAVIKGEKYLHDSGEKISSLCFLDQNFLVKTSFPYYDTRKPLKFH